MAQTDNLQPFRLTITLMPDTLALQVTGVVAVKLPIKLWQDSHRPAIACWRIFEPIRQSWEFIYDPRLKNN